MFDREAAHAIATDDVDGTVFLSAGSLEGGDEAFGGHRAMYDRLDGRGYPSLRLHWREFEGETHQSVIGAATVRGLREVFAS